MFLPNLFPASIQSPLTILFTIHVVYDSFLQTFPSSYVLFHPLTQSNLQIHLALVFTLHSYPTSHFVSLASSRLRTPSSLPNCTTTLSFPPSFPHHRIASFLTIYQEPTKRHSLCLPSGEAQLTTPSSLLTREICPPPPTTSLAVSTSLTVSKFSFH